MRVFWKKLYRLKEHLRSRFSLIGVWLRYGTDGYPPDLLISPGARVLEIDGGRNIFGNKCNIACNATILSKNGNLVVGSSSHIGTGAMIVTRESITIGRNVLIAEYVTIRDQDHAFDEGASDATSAFVTSPVTIGDNVWLGAKVTVTRGVTIGDNAVIGANSVVTQDIPANTLAAGTPARVIRNITANER